MLGAPLRDPSNLEKVALCAWDRADRVVMLEIDEGQHKYRPCECEQTRMMNVSQAIGCERTECG